MWLRFFDWMERHWDLPYAVYRIHSFLSSFCLSPSWFSSGVFCWVSGFRFIFSLFICGLCTMISYCYFVLIRCCLGDMEVLPFSNILDGYCYHDVSHCIFLFYFYMWPGS